MNETEKGHAKKANFRQIIGEEDSGHNCNGCEYLEVKIFNPEDEDSPREFFCRRNQFKIADTAFETMRWTCNYYELNHLMADLVTLIKKQNGEITDKNKESNSSRVGGIVFLLIACAILVLWIASRH